MAIVIENKESGKDRFKVKCPTCGRELSYLRSDVRPHRNWPHGYIYCPGCKAPIGHDESHLVETGIEQRKEVVSQVSREELLAKAERLRKIATMVTIISGILCFVGLVGFLAILHRMTSVGDEVQERLIGAFLPIPIMVFFTGIGLIPLFISSWVSLYKTNAMIEDKEKYEQ